ncbi:hypothetical protein PHLGIDRAFT_355938 [Phlebiopsis gigantea 11061_1 CR5-6]|uniref:Uncharacterized protein n=1 Tax=Phlebiopsis gigantea (strain 11061_1 CR5-6) TaxID=745531 RepID=A0A0C3NAD2_PHLG1|nr:hypothetical protein PHLGIDRAFT_355938 [Phlebiopsis gigantea 11061_1 CR5-6]
MRPLAPESLTPVRPSRERCDVVDARQPRPIARRCRRTWQRGRTRALRSPSLTRHLRCPRRRAWLTAFPRERSAQNLGTQGERCGRARARFDEREEESLDPHEPTAVGMHAFATFVLRDTAALVALAGGALSTPPCCIFLTSVAVGAPLGRTACPLNPSATLPFTRHLRCPRAAAAAPGLSGTPSSPPRARRRRSSHAFGRRRRRGGWLH